MHIIAQKRKAVLQQSAAVSQLLTVGESYERVANIRYR